MRLFHCVRQMGLWYPACLAFEVGAHARIRRVTRCLSDTASVLRHSHRICGEPRAEQACVLETRRDQTCAAQTPARQSSSSRQAPRKIAPMRLAIFRQAPAKSAPGSMARSISTLCRFALRNPSRPSPRSRNQHAGRGVDPASCAARIYTTGKGLALRVRSGHGAIYADCAP